MARLANPELALRRRRQILDAALHCFRRRGFHQATMQEICAEAAISAGALYRYFPSKADLIAAIAEDERREHETALTQAAQDGGLIDALSAMAGRFFERVEAAEESTIYAEVMAEAMRDPLLAKRLREIDEAGVARIADAIRRALALGEVSVTVSPEDAARTLRAAMEGLAMRRAFAKGQAAGDAVQLFRTLSQRYLTGPA